MASLAGSLGTSRMASPPLPLSSLTLRTHRMTDSAGPYVSTVFFGKLPPRDLATSPDAISELSARPRHA